MVIGIIMVVLYIFNLIRAFTGKYTWYNKYYTMMYYLDIVASLMGIVSAFVLIYGAQKRSKSALVVYRFLALIMIIPIMTRIVLVILRMNAITEDSSSK